MKNKEMRVNIDISLEEVREFYVENLKLMAKLLEAASNIGDTLEMIAPICRGEEVPEVDEQANANEEWLKNLFSQSEETGCADDDYPEEDDVEDGTEENDEDEAEALAITLLKAVFQALSETFDEYQ